MPFVRFFVCTRCVCLYEVEGRKYPLGGVAAGGVPCPRNVWLWLIETAPRPRDIWVTRIDTDERSIDRYINPSISFIELSKDRAHMTDLSIPCIDID